MCICHENLFKKNICSFYLLFLNTLKNILPLKFLRYFISVSSVIILLYYKNNNLLYFLKRSKMKIDIVQKFIDLHLDNTHHFNSFS